MNNSVSRSRLTEPYPPATDSPHNNPAGLPSSSQHSPSAAVYLLLLPPPHTTGTASPEHQDVILEWIRGAQCLYTRQPGDNKVDKFNPQYFGLQTHALEYERVQQNDVWWTDLARTIFITAHSFCDGMRSDRRRMTPINLGHDTGIGRRS